MDELVISRATLYEMILSVTLRAASIVPEDVKQAMQDALDRETNEIARLHMTTFLENVELARQRGTFACSDTGWPIYYIRIGDNVQLQGGFSVIYDLAREVVAQATKEVKLRPTMVHPLTRENPGDNVGYYLPRVEIRFDPHIDFLEVTAIPKGGGSEMFGTFYKMLLAADGKAGVIKFALDCFLESTYGGQTCAPNIVGVGIGGTAEICMEIAKEAAVLRPIGRRHPNREIAELEEELLEQINSLGVGPMGMGGCTAAFDVHIECAMTHSGALPVAYVGQCAIARRASARLGPDGRITFPDVTEWSYR